MYEFVHMGSMFTRSTRTRAIVLRITSSRINCLQVQLKMRSTLKKSTRSTNTLNPNTLSPDTLASCDHELSKFISWELNTCRVELANSWSGRSCSYENCFHSSWSRESWSSVYTSMYASPRQWWPSLAGQTPHPRDYSGDRVSYERIKTTWKSQRKLMFDDNCTAWA